MCSGLCAPPCNASIFSHLGFIERHTTSEHPNYFNYITGFRETIFLITKFTSKTSLLMPTVLPRETSHVALIFVLAREQTRSDILAC